MTEWAPKRFWKSAETVALADGYGVVLDGREVRTPAKALLCVPSDALANRIAAEFDAQEDRLDPARMPFTRMANSAIDKVAVQHADVANMLTEYGDSDLLCYRAEGPEDLVARQAAQWDPMLDWASEVLGARLHPRVGVIHIPQDPDAVARLGARVHAMSHFELAAFHDLVSISGSLVIGFAAWRDARPAEDLWTLSRLDEIWQEEQWGRDDEAQEMAQHKKAAFLNAAEFVRLINGHSET